MANRSTSKSKAGTGYISRNNTDPAFWPKMPVVQLPASHPIVNEENHTALLGYVRDRMDFGNTNREDYTSRYAQIDKQLSGYVRLDDADRKRQRENVRGFSPKPTAMNITLTRSQLQERLTYLMSVFAPETGMFEALAPKAEQKLAQAFTHKLNDDATEAQYYLNMAKGFWAGLKYNIGGWDLYWEDRMGMKVTNTTDGKAAIKNQIVWQGTCMEALDVYNFIWDRSVPVWRLAEEGEFFATIKVKRAFQVLKAAQQGKLLGIERFMKSTQVGKINVDPPGSGLTYFRRKPAIRLEINDTGDTTDGAKHTDWVGMLSQGRSGEVMSGVELSYFTGWLVPSWFGLSKETNYEIWRIILAQGVFIVYAEKMQNGHGRLPVSVIAPNEEDLEMQEKSDAELLLPLNTFGSFLLNTHVQATRKSLYGLTIYDPTVVPIREIPDGEVAGLIPIKPTGATKDIRAHFQQFFDAPRTEQTLTQLQETIAIMQHLIPTNISQQVASLERATMYQAAATVQGTNRRSLLLAKICESQAINNLRFQLMFNIMEKLTVIEYINEQGVKEEIDMAQLRSAKLEYVISEGLKGIDRLLVVEAMKEILMAIIQNREALQEIDVVDMLNYWSSLLGEKTDLTQFRKKTVWSGLPPQIQQVVEQAIQSGQLNPIIQTALKAQADAQLAANRGQSVQGALPSPDAITKQEGMLERQRALTEGRGPGGAGQ